MVQLTGEKMEPLDNIYHSTQVEVAAAIENDEEVELATAVQRIVAWIINRVIEVVLMIPAFGLIIALVLKTWKPCLPLYWVGWAWSWFYT